MASRFDIYTFWGSPDQKRLGQVITADHALQIIMAGGHISCINVTKIRETLGAPDNLRTAKQLLPWVQNEKQRIHLKLLNRKR